MAEINETIRQALQPHIARVATWPGGVLDQVVPWRPGAWIAAAEHSGMKGLGVRDVVDRLTSTATSSGRDPGSISRADVVEVGDSNASMFLASMIFGFGTVGYGPARVAKMIDGTPDIEDRLARLAESSVDGDGAVWSAIVRDAKVKGLGIAFGTKVTYFFGLREGGGEPQTLIDDLNTSWAAYGLAGIVRSLDRRDSFLEYQDLCRGCANAFGVRSDVVEYALFKLGQENMAIYRAMASSKNSA